MLRLSSILTIVALAAVFAVPASAAPWETFRTSYQPAQPEQFRTSYQPVPAPDSGDFVLNRDYGSPDAVDAARDLPRVQIATVEARDSQPDGFDWGDAGIGAGGIAALFILAGATALTLTSYGRRKRLA